MTNWKDTVVVQDGDDISFYQDDGCRDGNRWMDGSQVVTLGQEDGKGQACRV